MADFVNTNPIADRLMHFGLTRQEAAIYLFLLTHNSLTGYEVSKLMGISRSNVYTALNSLVDNGAAYQISGSPSKYVAVPAEEYCSNRLQSLTRDKEYILANLPSSPEENDGYITISGDRNILDKICNILRTAQHRIYLSVPKNCLKDMSDSLEALVNTKKKLVIVSDYEPSCVMPMLKEKLLPENENADNFDTAKTGVFYYKTKRNVSDVRLISDSAYCLTGEYGNGNNSCCLYSGQRNFINIIKEAMRNEILLSKIM